MKKLALAPIDFTFDLQVMLVPDRNAFVLWTDINAMWSAGKLYRRRIFLEMLDKALVTLLIQRRKRMPRAPAAIALIYNRQAEGASASLTVATGIFKKRARCNFCPSSNDNKTITHPGQKLCFVSSSIYNTLGLILITWSQTQGQRAQSLW
ncbi:UNVERIFIED_CONTAM: hypothetical protein FKN15_055857 [Acipenser sinensis]